MIADADRWAAKAGSSWGDLSDDAISDEPVDLATILRTPASRAARAYGRELVYGPDPEADLPPSERTERWERIRELGTMPERMLQRETKMQLHGGGGDRGGKKKQRAYEPPAATVPDLPVTGWAPGPQLAIWVTRGTGEYFQRAPLDEPLRAVRIHVEQLKIARAYPERALPKRNRRARLLVIRGADFETARLAKKHRAWTSEALFEWALAHAGGLVRAYDRIEVA